MRRKLPWFEIVLAVVFLSANAYAAFSDSFNLPNRWFIRDDAYYYFKVAQNITEGRGSTFDGIHPTNGYHPLWLLICIPVFALARYDLILPLRVLVLVTGILQIATAVLLYRLVRNSISPPAGMLAACFWSFHSYILLFLYKTGVESSIALFLIVLLLYVLQGFEGAWRRTRVKRSQIALFGIIALLTTFARLDLIFFALIIGIWIVFRDSPMRYLVPLDILAVVLGTIGAFILRLGFAAYYDVAGSALIVLGAGLLIKLPVLYLCRLYESPNNWTPGKLSLRLLLAVIISGALLGAVLLVGGFAGVLPTFSRAILALDAGLSFGWLLLIRVAGYAFRFRSGPALAARPLDQLAANWKQWLGEGAVYYGILGGGLGAYMLWNRVVFGTFTPVSGQIKHWWATFIHSIYGTAPTSWLTFLALNPFSDFNAWAPPTTTLSDWSNRFLYKEATGFGNPRWQAHFLWVLGISALAVLLILLLRRRKSIRAVVQAGMIPLFAGSWLQIIAYNVTGYASPKEWYWLTEPVLLVVLGAAIINLVFELAPKKWGASRLLFWVFVAWYGLNGAYAYWRDTYALNPYGQTPPGTPYMDVIPLLETSTRPGDVIGMTGGGNIAYLMPTRTIVNMDGLINSNQYFQALQSGQGADYLYDTGMRYVFANPDLLAANPYRGQYAQRLELVFHWGGKDLMRLLAPSSP
jgi:hypothetical protein